MFSDGYVLFFYSLILHLVVMNRFFHSLFPWIYSRWLLSRIRPLSEVLVFYVVCEGGGTETRPI